MKTYLGLDLLSLSDVVVVGDDNSCSFWSTARTRGQERRTQSSSSVCLFSCLLFISTSCIRRPQLTTARPTDGRTDDQNFSFLREKYTQRIINYYEADILLVYTFKKHVVLFCECSKYRLASSTLPTGI